MIIWSCDGVIIWSYDHRIRWAYDQIIWSYDQVIWSYDHVIMWSCNHILWSHDRRIMWSLPCVVFLTIFGRTDLRISLSEAKCHAEADFEVRSAVAHQKLDQIDKHLFFLKNWFTSQTTMPGTCVSKFCIEPRYQGPKISHLNRNPMKNQNIVPRPERQPQFPDDNQKFF